MIDLTRMHVSFTGRLKTMNRKQAMALASACGAFSQAQPTASTQLIVVGVIEKPFTEELSTKKIAYAHEFNLPTINELQFLEWCELKIAQRIQNLE